MLSLEEHRGKMAYFAGVDKVRFRKPVRPGDCLVTEVTMLWHRGTFGRFNAVGTVDGAVVVEAEIAFYLADRADDSTRRSK
jgi:3-hydroxymyristoyl/3-hydroxydecanoyl-(acyl carrier protein) dehydratase